MDENTVKVNLRFQISGGGVWQGCGSEGEVEFRVADGGLLPEVELAEDGLPLNRNLRDAVEAGIAVIE